MSHSRRRFAYWLGQAEVADLSDRYRDEGGRKIFPVKGVPCKGMHADVDVSFVAPGEWDKVCHRQGSWYRASARRGQYLVLTDERNRLPDRVAATVIETSDFEPPRLPDAEDIAELARDEAYARVVPEGWRDITDRDRAHWRRMLSMVSARGELDDLLDRHSANHANFVAPRFYVTEEEGGGRTPYSIGSTAVVCSACVELFGLVAPASPVKYVMPCPGLVTFAGLEADRYLRVSDPSACDRERGAVVPSGLEVGE